MAVFVFVLVRTNNTLERRKSRPARSLSGCGDNFAVVSRYRSHSKRNYKLISSGQIVITTLFRASVRFCYDCDGAFCARERPKTETFPVSPRRCVKLQDLPVYIANEKRRYFEVLYKVSEVHSSRNEEVLRGLHVLDKITPRASNNLKAKRKCRTRAGWILVLKTRMSSEGKH